MPEALTPESISPPAPPASLARAARVADYTMIALAVLLGGGSIVLFAWAGRPTLLRMNLSPKAALWWNALLSLVFFVQHSVMVRRSVRARLAAFIPARYDGAFYAISSGVVLALVAALYQRVEAPPVFALHGVPRLIVIVVALLAVAFIAWAVHALRTFDPCGIRPIREHLRNGPAVSSAAKEFVVRGPFRWVRHPLYFAIIVLFWAAPEMTLSRLELAALWTAWMIVGALLEERDLKAEFGGTYREYCRRVPMLIPWRGPAPAQFVQ